jgi:rRNA maturation endonuclease Nob1
MDWKVGIGTKNSVRIERTCPRCHRRFHNWYHFKTKRVTCGDCGHDWPARLKRDEDPRIQEEA